MPSLTRGGAETQLVDLINHLDSSRFEKTLIIFDKNVDQLDRIDQGCVDFFQLIRAFKFDGRIVLRLAALIRNQQPDVVHCTNQFTMILAWLATRLVRRKPKLLVAVHSTKQISLGAEVRERTLYRWVMAQSDCITFVCLAQAEYWRGKYKEVNDKSIVVYNGVDTTIYDSGTTKDAAARLRARLKIGPDELVIACIASFRAEKAHALLIDAWSQLDKAPHLILAGDGPLRSEIEAQVRLLELQGRTHFLGNIADVRPVLEIADVTVLASATEAFSIAMLESMAMKTPVVATDVGGLREAVIPEETGYLLAPGDVNELKATLAAALSDRHNLARLGANARTLVQEKFSTAKVVEQTEKVLSRLIGSKPLSKAE